MNRLLSIREIALSLGCHPVTLYRLVERGQIPFVKIKGRIRFKPEAIAEWIEQKSFSPIAAAGSYPQVELSLKNYDKLLLRNETKKGGVKMSPKGKTWHYPFGSVILRLTKSGMERWYVYYRIQGKRIRECVQHAQGRADALKALSLKVADAFRGEHGLRLEPKRIGFMDFAAEFIEKYAKPNKRSWRDDLYALKTLNRFFGKLFLHEVTAFDIESFKAARVKEVSKSRVNRNLDLVKKLFSLACDWGYLEESPARKVKKFPVFNVVERILKRGEQVRLLEASAPHLRPVLIALLNTGCRKSEILGLEWGQIDFQQRQIRVERTKSGRDRFIPINSVLFSVLESLQAVDGQSEYVFLGPDGKAMRDIKTSFKTACRQAGIEGMRIHDLRHTAASRMVEAGIDLPTVSKILGHASITTTMRYAHPTSENMKRAAETLAFVPTVSPQSKNAQTNVLRGLA